MNDHGMFPHRLPKAAGVVPLPVLWYAFCSSEYLSHQKDNKLESPTFVAPQSYDMAAERVKGVVTLHPKHPKLPEEIVFLQSGKVIGSAGHISLPEQFQGYTNAILRTDSLSPVDTAWLPKRALFLAYFPSAKDDKAVEIACVVRCEITVDEVRALESFNGEFPALGKQAQITDRRFADPQHPRFVFSYLADNWLTDDQVEKLPGFGNARGKSLATVPLRLKEFTNGSGVRWAVMVVGAGTLGALIFLIRSQGWKKTNKNT